MKVDMCLNALRMPSFVLLMPVAGSRAECAMTSFCRLCRILHPGVAAEAGQQAAEQIKQASKRL